MRDTMPEFVGRELLVRLLWERLQASSLLLFGPRRIGKSRTLDEMAAGTSSGRRLVRVDLQGATTDLELLARLRDLLETRAGQAERLLERVDSVELPVGGVHLAAREGRDAWSEIEDLLVRAGPTDDEEVLVLALDEVPWWLDALERRAPGAARTALAQLRRLRGDRRFAKCRWVLTGSVGMATRAARWQASAELNDLDVVEVPPLDVAAARTLFEMTCLERGKEAEVEAARMAGHLAGGRPHWIKVLAERSAAATDATVTAATVEREVSRMLGTQFRQLFQEEGEGHFSREYTPDDRAIVGRVLGALCTVEGGLPRRGLVATGLTAQTGVETAAVARVLHRLVEEFTLVERGPDGDTLAIAVPLFARWWARWGLP